MGVTCFTPWLCMTYIASMATCSRPGCTVEFPDQPGGKGKGRPKRYHSKTCANLASRQRMRALMIPAADEELVASIEHAEEVVSELLLNYARQVRKPLPGARVQAAAKLLVANAMATVLSA